MDLVDIARMIVEKALRYVSPDWLTVGLEGDPTLLKDAVPPEAVDRFVDRLGVEARMMNVPLDEPAIRLYLLETQCDIPVSTLPGMVWNALTNARLQEEFRQTQAQMERVQAQMRSMQQASHQRLDAGRIRAWLEGMDEKKDAVPPAPSQAPAPVPPPAPPPAQASETPAPAEASEGSFSEPPQGGQRPGEETKGFETGKAKGFGFVTPGESDKDIVVHVSDALAPASPASRPAASVPAAPVKTGRRDPGQHKLDRVRPKRPGVDGREYDATIVKVFYATDRGRASASGEGIAYDWQRSATGKLEYGECEVSIPDTHVMGGWSLRRWCGLNFDPIRISTSFFGRRPALRRRRSTRG